MNKSVDFTNMSKDLLLEILSDDEFSCPEEELFFICARWSAAECTRKNLTVDATNQREMLNDLIHLIRFPIMKQKFIATEVEATKILSKDELLDIFMYIASGTNDRSHLIIRWIGWYNTLPDTPTSSCNFFTR